MGEHRLSRSTLGHLTRGAGIERQQLARFGRKTVPKVPDRGL
jgi:hypothetical protein